jgi:hypothetical protein
MKMNRNGHSPSLLAALGKLLRSWWEVDRIRVSRRTGSLLRIHPPCLISIDDRIIEVTSRMVSQSPLGPAVRYVCRTPHGLAELCVIPPVAGGKTHIVWEEAGREQTLVEDEVQVWG